MTNNNDKKILNVPPLIDKGNVIRNVPALRFPEFSGEWSKDTLQNVVAFSNGKAHESCVDENGCYILVNSKFISTEGSVIKKATLQLSPLFKSQFVMVMSDLPNGKALAKCFYIEEDNIYTLNQRICSFTTRNRNISRFLMYQINRNKYYLRYDDGINQTNLKKGEVLACPVFIPSIQEQTKIATFIHLLDKRIATQNKIIERYESLIRGIMVELQKQGLKRGTWKKVFLNDILKERNERNSNLYQVFSVSVSQGIINQVDHLGRSFSAKDTSKYNVVHYGDLVYTKSPTGSFPYGIVKQSLNHESVAVSPLYGVYVPDSLAIGIYLHKYFMSEINTQNYLHPLIQKGAKNTINITNQHFLENRVPIPLDSNELLLISKLLRSLNDEIRHEQNMLQEYQKQKQYLLRQMFI